MIPCQPCKDDGKETESHWAVGFSQDSPLPVELCQEHYKAYEASGMSIQKWMATRKPKPSDDLFILCDKPECFPEHEFNDTIPRVHYCKSLEGKIKVNWD